MEGTGGERRYSVGSLSYDLPQLLLVSAMMLLATQTLSLVCYNLVPNVKPILLDRAGATSTEIALIIGTIPQAINFVLCPVISTLSDRTRTPLGRRMPYLLFSAPLLVLVLVLIAWSGGIAAGLGRLVPGLAGRNLHFWVLAVLVLCFQVLYLFPGSVVYYLIADVIPKECIGRYTAVTSILGSALGAGFSFFVLELAIDHLKPTFCVIGALYLLVYLALALLVKEGSYPPVTDAPAREGGALARGREYLWMFFRQCFRRRIFVLLFLCTGLNQASNICRGMYNVLFATKDIGMSVGTYGRIAGIGSVVSAALVYFIGRIMDRTHPLYIYLGGGIFIMGINVFGYLFVHSTMTFAVIGIATSIMYAVQNLANSPLLIDLLPMEKYGQFASANSMVNSLAVLAGSWLGGCLTQAFGYRVMFVWDFFVTLLATLALLGVRTEWRRLGGKDAYRPPAIE